MRKLYRCDGCAEIYYCGRECQKADRNRHKTECRQAKQAKQTEYIPQELRKDGELSNTLTDAYERILGENKYYCGIVSQEQHTQIMQNVSVRAANVTRIMLFTKAHGTQIWGFFAVHGGGLTTHKTTVENFGQPWTIVSPGVSIKPYPCGVLTHPTIDLMIKLVVEHDIQPDDIESVIIRAGSNILNPIRYPVASNHLEAKFSLQAVLSMVALTRQAGKLEFEDDFVQSAAMQAMQRRMKTQFDPEIEAKGFDKMRSSIEIVLNNGSTFGGDADERYRGGPEFPLTDNEVKDKVRACSKGTLTPSNIEALIDSAATILDQDDVSLLARLIQAG